jgi:hypothetical protein
MSRRARNFARPAIQKRRALLAIGRTFTLHCGVLASGDA